MFSSFMKDLDFIAYFDFSPGCRPVSEKRGQLGVHTSSKNLFYLYDINKARTHARTHKLHSKPLFSFKAPATRNLV